MAVAYRSIGAVKKNTGSGNMASVALPLGHTTNDILVLIVHATDNVVCSVNQGYTLKGAVNSGTFARQEIWWKRDGGAEVAPTVTHAGGNDAEARIIAVSGCVTSGDPFSDFAQNPTTGSKTATSTDISPNDQDLVIFALTAGTNGGTSGGSQGWSGYSGLNPSWTERGDDLNQAGSNDVSGSEATGTVSGSGAMGTRTAVQGWSYTAAQTNVVAGMMALTASAGGAAKAITPAAITATSDITAAVVRLRPVAPAAITSSSAVTASIVRLRPVVPGAVTASSNVTASVSRARPLVVSAINATSSVTAAVARARLVVPAAITATSPITFTLAAKRAVVPASITATSLVTASVVRLRPVTPGALTATSDVTASVTRFGTASILPAGISATSAVTATIVRRRALAISAVSATSTITLSLAALHRIVPAGVVATSDVTAMVGTPGATPTLHERSMAGVGI